MFAKKRKAQESPESPADGSDDFEPLPSICRPTIDRELQEADEALAAIQKSAKQMRKKLRQQAKTIKDLITRNGGQLMVTGRLDGEIEINVGGTVLCVPRKPLLLPGVSESIIAYLLLYHLDGLPKDAEGRPFLNADPVTGVGAADAQGESHEILLTPPHDTDSSSLFWHHLLFTTKTGLDIDAPAETAAHTNDDDHMQLDALELESEEEEGEEGEEDDEDEGKEGEEGDHMATVKSSTASLDASVGRLGEVQRGLANFHKTVKPLLATEEGGQGGGVDEIRSVRVLDKTVSTTAATLARVGRDKRLYTTFHSGSSVSCIRPNHLMKVIDFARRRRCAPPGSIVKSPTASNCRQIQGDTEMYGLKYEPFFSGVAGGGFVIETDDEMAELLKMTGKTSPMPSLVYKGSRDTYAFPKMLECVAGKSGLLFALRDGDAHRFGCFIDSPLDPPKDPTKANIYKAPVFFYALSGAYETPTKIELPERRQSVGVAGTQGVVKAHNMDYRAKVAMGGIACGHLWLGWGQPGPAADLSRCHQGINKECLSEGYRGRRDSTGNGTLAKSETFTCDEMEIWQVDFHRLTIPNVEDTTGAAGSGCVEVIAQSRAEAQPLSQSSK
ncbi:unnamed protein product [Vitrella brassicaformis CCMP3155]|uniref:Uncharacterized protein n=1 Tax=Vitrella brassicaformis (strain CCMP3155) TaxID=1169540 RepID=A0A0G4EJA1_VITBC|nr:unnamed protein product [Vitrella brassicaformis CCMP3155]|eukprot:CEL95995.1 unnamed protein product [Vitrella brassicaformis CCMP3155]